MADTQKPMSSKDGNLTLKQSFNDNSGALAVEGWVTGLVGRKVTMAIETTTATDDTEVYTFLENGVQLMELTVIYTDDTRSVLLSVERTA